MKIQYLAFDVLLISDKPVIDAATADNREQPKRIDPVLDRRRRKCLSELQEDRLNRHYPGDRL